MSSVPIGVENFLASIHGGFCKICVIFHQSGKRDEDQEVRSREGGLPFQEEIREGSLAECAVAAQKKSYLNLSIMTQ